MDYFSASVVIVVLVALLFSRDEPRRRIAGRPLVRTRDLFRD